MPLLAHAGMDIGGPRPFPALSLAGICHVGHAVGHEHLPYQRVHSDTICLHVFVTPPLPDKQITSQKCSTILLDGRMEV